MSPVLSIPSDVQLVPPHLLPSFHPPSTNPINCRGLLPIPQPSLLPNWTPFTLSFICFIKIPIHQTQKSNLPIPPPLSPLLAPFNPNFFLPIRQFFFPHRYCATRKLLLPP
jgi:hypothetical protein